MGKRGKTNRNQIYIGILAGLMAAGCRPADSDTNCFHSMGWKDATEARSHLNAYKSIVLARVFEDHWEDRGPHRTALHHVNATVTKSFKGEWKVLEDIAYWEAIDAPAPPASNGLAGRLIYVFTNEHTNAEVNVDTGQWGCSDSETEHALQLAFSNRSSPRGARNK